MAVGIQNIEAAIADVSGMVDAAADLASDPTAISKEIKDVPTILMGLYHLAVHGKAAVDAGEIKDLDAEEAKKLLTEIFELGAKVVSVVKPAA